MRALGEIADGVFAAAQPLEDRAARGIGQGEEHSSIVHYSYKHIMIDWSDATPLVLPADRIGRPRAREGPVGQNGRSN